jgi:hypothetical protein
MIKNNAAPQSQEEVWVEQVRTAAKTRGAGPIDKFSSWQTVELLSQNKEYLLQAIIYGMLLGVPAPFDFKNKYPETKGIFRYLTDEEVSFLNTLHEKINVFQLYFTKDFSVFGGVFLKGPFNWKYLPMDSIDRIVAGAQKHGVPVPVSFTDRNQFKEGFYEGFTSNIRVWHLVAAFFIYSLYTEYKQ